MQKSTFFTIVLTSLVTALLVIGFYNYPSFQAEKTSPQQQTQTEVITETQDLSTKEPATLAIPNFDSIQEYALLVSDSSRHGAFKVAQPAGFQRINFGGNDLNIGLDGVSSDIYVLASENRPNSLDINETFYLEVVSQAPCFTQSDCDPATSEFFGPFEGKVGRMTQ